MRTASCQFSATTEGARTGSVGSATIIVSSLWSSKACGAGRVLTSEHGNVLGTSNEVGKESVGTYKTSDFRKGLKVQIDGEPYLMVEMNFVKPGKGNALYKCKLRNLLRGTVLDRTYKGGDSLESADVEEINVQYLYRQLDTFVFMDSKTYEQYELTADQVDDNWKYLKEGMGCSMMLFNGNPVTMSPPNHVELKVEYCEPGVKGDTATNVTKPVKVETGAEILCPSFINMGNVIKVDTRTGQYVERVST
jgi:elongation factor P